MGNSGENEVERWKEAIAKFDRDLVETQNEIDTKIGVLGDLIVTGRNADTLQRTIDELESKKKSLTIGKATAQGRLAEASLDSEARDRELAEIRLNEIYAELENAGALFLGQLLTARTTGRKIRELVQQGAALRREKNLKAPLSRWGNLPALDFQIDAMLLGLRHKEFPEFQVQQDSPQQAMLDLLVNVGKKAS